MTGDTDVQLKEFILDCSLLCALSVAWGESLLGEGVKEHHRTSICAVELLYLKLTSWVGAGEEGCCNLMTLDSPDRSEVLAWTPKGI